MISKELRVGVLLTDPVQMLDMACVDLFGMLSTSYLSECGLPGPIVSLGTDCKIYYIGKQKGDKSQGLTADARICLTHTTSDAAVSPGNIDVLLIPGPDPKSVPDEEAKAFVQAHNTNKTTILAVCTGAFTAAYSGIYDGVHVTGPRALIPSLRKKFPEAKWDDSMRVVQDGHIWTGGGVTNGNDLVAAYIRAHFPSALAETICAMAEVGDRPLSYDIGPNRSMLFFIWQTIKALFSSK